MGITCKSAMVCHPYTPSPTDGRANGLSDEALSMCGS